MRGPAKALLLESKSYDIKEARPKRRHQKLRALRAKREFPSHIVRSTFGKSAVHSTLTTCLGIKTSPVLGAISLALYFFL
jgi:hypothetical protein